LIERRIRFTETARQHIEREKAWLLQNRGNATALLEELRNSVRILRALPGIGSRQERAGIVGLRRVFLEKIGCHLYYTFNDREVFVRALWGARKRRTPRIKPLP